MRKQENHAKRLTHRAKINNLVVRHDTAVLLGAQILNGSRLQTDTLVAKNLEQGLGELRRIDPRRGSPASIDADAEPFHTCGAVVGVEPLGKHDLRDADPSRRD
jgi:hypothetical protein